MTELLPHPVSRHEAEQQEVVLDLQGIASEVLTNLSTYDALRPLRPERYWKGGLSTAWVDYVTSNQGLPVEVDYDKKQRTMFVHMDRIGFEEYVAGYGDESPQANQDMLRLFVGYGLVHDLAIRALSPEKAEDFIEHITHPNGLYNAILGDRTGNSYENEEVIREYVIGDDDRVAKVNVARFAVGAVCEAMRVNDGGFRKRITRIFRSEFGTFLQNGNAYRQMAQDVFDQSPKKANEMFVEHIKDFDLAAAYPKTSQEVEEFVNIYGEV